MLRPIMGVPADQVVLCEDGDAVVLDEGGLRRDGTVPAGYLYVDGTVGDVGHGVLRDRRLLSEEGVVMVVAAVDLQRRTLCGDPQIATKGLVHVPESEELLGEASRTVAAALVEALEEGSHDLEVLTRQARRALGRLVNERIHRRPLIVPVIMAM